MASTGAIERLARGIYRMAGSPAQEHESIYARWLALGGATTPRTMTGVRVRLRVRTLNRDEVIPVAGLPALTVDRTIADLVEIGTDTSLVADALRDAVRADKLVAPDRLVEHLSPIANRRNATGRALANDLFELAGVRPKDGTMA